MIEGAVLYAASLERLVGFYSALGFVLIEQTEDDFATLRARGASLTLVQIPEPYRSEVEITDPPTIRESTPIKLVLRVHSIEGALDIVTERGGILPPNSAIWEHDGQRVHDAVDPEGNVIQLREPPGE